MWGWIAPSITTVLLHGRPACAHATRSTTAHTNYCQFAAAADVTAPFMRMYLVGRDAHGVAYAMRYKTPDNAGVMALIPTGKGHVRNSHDMLRLVPGDLHDKEPEYILDLVTDLRVAGPHGDHRTLRVRDLRSVTPHDIAVPCYNAVTDQLEMINLMTPPDPTPDWAAGHQLCVSAAVVMVSDDKRGGSAMLPTASLLVYHNMIKALRHVVALWVRYAMNHAAGPDQSPPLSPPYPAPQPGMFARLLANELLTAVEDTTVRHLLNIYRPPTQTRRMPCVEKDIPWLVRLCAFVGPSAIAVYAQNCTDAAMVRWGRSTPTGRVSPHVCENDFGPVGRRPENSFTAACACPVL